jgi:hypothetical protein
LIKRHEKWIEANDTVGEGEIKTMERAEWEMEKFVEKWQS